MGGEDGAVTGSLEFRLRERVKELTTLHGWARVLQQSDPASPLPLDQLVALIPPGWQFPAICCARIQVDGHVVSTPNWQTTPWLQSTALSGGGLLEIAYTERPTTVDEVFLREEYELIASLGELLSAHLARTRAEAKLRRSERLLRVAGRVARVGGWMMSLPATQMTWSDEACEIHAVLGGTSPTIAEAVAFCAPEFQGVVSAAFAQCLTRGASFDLELQIVADGTRRWLRSIGHADRDAEGAIVGIHGAFQDIDDRRKLEDQFRQAQKMDAVGQLAGGVAHDFNNLLTVILSYTTFMLEDLDPSSPLRQDVSEIQQAGQRATELTRQLLTFTRQQVVRLRPLNLDAVIAGVGTMLRRLIGEGIVLRHIEGEPVGNILADPHQLEQVIVNLVVNARDAMSGGGQITIETSNIFLDEDYAAGHHNVTVGPHVQLAVTDTGHGMDAATIAHIFEPFFTTKEQGKGTGLGLATVYGIVRQFGGHIWVYSELGIGTTFKLYFPRVEQVVADAIPDAFSRRREPAGRETILVVEDVNQVRTIIRTVLSRAGYAVLDAPSGADAMVLVQECASPIHLMLTDVVMPNLSGRELATRMMTERPDMKVLYMSGYAEDAIVQHNVLAAGVEFLPKPITPDLLLRRVREVLDGTAS